MTTATQEQQFNDNHKPAPGSQDTGNVEKEVEQPADPIGFTDSAASKVAELIAEEDNDALMLRVFITGGGCSGFQYGFTFDEEIGGEDTVIKRSVTYEDPHNTGQQGEMTVTLLADPMSLIYLMNAEIDYNPNAQTTCGCGSSFSV